MSSSLPYNAAPQQVANSNPHNSPDLTIEILTFKKFTKGALAGWIDVLLPALGIKIHGLALFEKDGKKWVSPPQREYEQDGEKKYAPIIEFDSKEARQDFNNAVLSALDHFQRGGDV